MRDIINATIGENHFLKCSTYSIARNGEGLTPCLSISIPDGLKSFWAYIDFKKPNGEIVKTPRIDVAEGKIIYNIPGAVLDAEGELEVQVVFQNENGETWKTYVKEFAVRYSINATDDIPNKEDFITEAQKLVNEAVEVAKNVEERANNGEFDGKDGADGKDGENGKDAITDQTFNPESPNAQSGKAVAEAIANVGGGTEQLKRIKTITLEEDVTDINVTFDKGLKEIMLLMSASFDPVENNKTLSARTDNGRWYWFTEILNLAEDQRVFYARAREVKERLWEAISHDTLIASTQGIAASTTNCRLITSIRPNDVPRYIKDLNIFVGGRANKFKTGSTIEIWGGEAE